MKSPDRTHRTTGALENRKPHADSIRAACFFIIRLLVRIAFFALGWHCAALAFGGSAA